MSRHDLCLLEMTLPRQAGNINVTQPRLLRIAQILDTAARQDGLTGERLTRLQASLSDTRRWLARTNGGGL